MSGGRLMVWFRNLGEIMQDSVKRRIFIQNRVRNMGVMNLRTLGIYMCGSYILLTYYVLSGDSDYRYQLSYSRKISRLSGYMSQVSIPEVMRVPIYSIYGYIYKVNKDEMEQDLREFRNFSEYFTRRVRKRVIEDDMSKFVSPADSCILSYSEVDKD